MIVVDWWLILSTTTTCNFPCRTGCQDANSHCACQKRTNNAVCFRINGAHNAKSLCFRCNAPRIGSGSCEDIVALLLKMRLIPHIQVPSLMEVLVSWFFQPPPSTWILGHLQTLTRSVLSDMSTQA
ncbi:unnamed protein product [Urochloa humidicola]